MYGTPLIGRAREALCGQAASSLRVPAAIVYNVRARARQIFFSLTLWLLDRARGSLDLPCLFRDFLCRLILSRSVDVAFSKVFEAVGIGRIFPCTVLHFYDARGSYIRRIESVYNNVSFH